MKYEQETAFRILKAMEVYRDSVVPSPYEPLEDETGRPAPKPTKISPKPIAELSPVGIRTDFETPPSPETTHPKSWVGEMDSGTFLAHVTWLKQEKFITTTDGLTFRLTDLPEEITIAGVRLLKEVEVNGGWESAVEIAKEAKAPATLTSMYDTLRKAKPKK